MTSAVTGLNPVGGLFSRGAAAQAGTHWLSVGKDTGGRTSGVAVTAGPRALTHERDPQGRPSQRTGG